MPSEPNPAAATAAPGRSGNPAKVAAPAFVAPRQRLAALRGLFFGPIFLRELRVAARQRGTYVLRMAVPILLLGLLAIAYSAVFIDRGYGQNTAAARLQRLQQIAPVLSISMLWFYFALLPMAACALCSVSLVHERIRGTLSALASTPMSAGSIVLSTLSSRLVQLLIVSASTLPAVIVVSAYAGLPLSSVMEAVAVIATSTLLAASCGMALSLFGVKRTGAALGGSALYLLLNLYPVIGMIVMAALTGGGRAVPLPTVASPLWTMLGIDGVGPPMGGLSYSGVWHIPTSLAISGSLLFLSVVMWRPMVRVAMTGAPPRKRRKWSAAATPAVPGTQLPPGVDAAGAELSAPAPFDPAAQPPPISRSASRTVSDNPVLWRELQQLRPFAGFTRSVGTLLPFLLLAVINYYAIRDSVDATMGVLIAGMVFLVLIGVASSASSISPELQGRTMPLLLCSQISVSKFLWSKVAAGVLRFWPLHAALVLQCFIGLATGHSAGTCLFVLLIIAPTTAFAQSATSLAMAVHSRKPSTAAAATLGLAILVWIAPFAVLGIISVFLSGRSDTGIRSLYDVFVAFNPVYLIGETADVTLASRAWRRSGSFSFPSGGSIGITGWCFILALYASAATAWGIAFMAWARASFKRKILPRLV